MNLKLKLPFVEGRKLIIMKCWKRVLENDAKEHSWYNWAQRNINGRIGELLHIRKFYICVCLLVLDTEIAGLF